MDIKERLSVKWRVAIVALFFASCCVLFSALNYLNHATVHLNIVALSPEVSQIFWGMKSTSYLPERHSTVLLKPGEGDYSFKIEPSYDLSKLRFDPSTKESTIVIKQFGLKWDDKVVFDLAGGELRDALRPVNDVRITSNELDTSLVITSTGTDPILELDVARLTLGYRLLRLLKLGSLALVFSLVIYIALHSISIKSYAIRSHTTYPEQKRHWVYWGGAFFLLGVFLTIVTPVRLHGHYPNLFFVAISFIVGTLLFIPAFVFATRKERMSQLGDPSKFSWFWFALPSFIIWLSYLLAFWPGSMSPDSFDQWRQVLNGHLRDWHPAFHTMSIWLVTRIELSPATVAVAQIIALGSTAGWALSVLQRYGIPKIVLWFTSVLFALWPVNGFMVITLWKDVAYSIVLLILAVYVLQIVMQKGLWLASPKNWLCLAGILALVCLYRHNGIIPVCMTSFLLLCCYLRYWKEIVIATVLALLINAGVRGPLYDVLEVRRGNPMTTIQNKLLQDLSSTSLKSFYERMVKTTNQETKDVSGSDKAEEKKESSHASGKVLDRLYSASRLWRINELDFFHKRIEYVNLWQKGHGEETKIKYVSSNKFGIGENTLSSAGRDFLYNIFVESRSNKYLFWIWRPAVYLYSLAALTILLSWRLRRKLYLVVMPALLNSLPMFLVVIHKSVFRYHYPLVVLGTLLVLPLLFLRDSHGGGEDSSD